jgi:hypothetical protein
MLFAEGFQEDSTGRKVALIKAGRRPSFSKVANHSPLNALAIGGASHMTVFSTYRGNARHQIVTDKSASVHQSPRVGRAIAVGALPRELLSPGVSEAGRLIAFEMGIYPEKNRHSNRSASCRMPPGIRFLSSRKNSVSPLIAVTTALWTSRSRRLRSM